MKKLKARINYFSKAEILLWSFSVIFVTLSYILFDRENYLNLTASLIGITSLIFCAKGNPFGQVLMIVFSLLYGIISYTFRYYGEMITYLGMTLPIAVLALISWLKNPFSNDKSEVRVNNNIGLKQIKIMCILTIIVTIVFYFILKAFNTANIVPSTISITTSFVAAYLTVQRSPYFALAYAINDIILIVLWVLASITDVGYISVVVCFIAFLANDLYGYVSWRAMAKRQTLSGE